jgi:hypothetical protein
MHHCLLEAPPSGNRRKRKLRTCLLSVASVIKGRLTPTRLSTSPSNHGIPNEEQFRLNTSHHSPRPSEAKLRPLHNLPLQWSRLQPLAPTPERAVLGLVLKHLTTPHVRSPLRPYQPSSYLLNLLSFSLPGQVDTKSSQTIAEHNQGQPARKLCHHPRDD